MTFKDLEALLEDGVKTRSLINNYGDYLQRNQFSIEETLAITSSPGFSGDKMENLKVIFSHKKSPTKVTASDLRNIYELFSYTGDKKDVIELVTSSIQGAIEDLDIDKLQMLMSDFSYTGDKKEVLRKFVETIEVTSLESILSTMRIFSYSGDKKEIFSLMINYIPDDFSFTLSDLDRLWDLFSYSGDKKDVLKTAMKHLQKGFTGQEVTSLINTHFSYSGDKEEIRAILAGLN
jgi:hypothetical protein